MGLNVSCGLKFEIYCSPPPLLFQEGDSGRGSLPLSVAASGGCQTEAGRQVEAGGGPFCRR